MSPIRARKPRVLGLDRPHSNGRDVFLLFCGAILGICGTWLSTLGWEAFAAPRLSVQRSLYSAYTGYYLRGDTIVGETVEHDIPFNCTLGRSLTLAPASGFRLPGDSSLSVHVAFLIRNAGHRPATNVELTEEVDKFGPARLSVRGNSPAQYAFDSTRGPAHVIRMSQIPPRTSVVVDLTWRLSGDSLASYLRAPVINLHRVVVSSSEIPARRLEPEAVPAWETAVVEGSEPGRRMSLPEAGVLRTGSVPGSYAIIHRIVEWANYPGLQVTGTCRYNGPHRIIPKDTTFPTTIDTVRIRPLPPESTVAAKGRGKRRPR
jgi:hypothetical protein